MKKNINFQLVKVKTWSKSILKEFLKASLQCLCLETTERNIILTRDLLDRLDNHTMTITVGGNNRPRCLLLMTIADSAPLKKTQACRQLSASCFPSTVAPELPDS